MDAEKAASETNRKLLEQELAEKSTWSNAVGGNVIRR